MGIGKQGIAQVAGAAGLGIFGDGSDGDVVTAGGGVGDVTLTRDMFYDNLTVTAGDTITTAGYRIAVKETLTNNGTIENNGGDSPSDQAEGEGADGGTLSGGGDGAKITNYCAGAGGGGAGVIVIAAKTINNSSGTIQANGGDASNAITGQNDRSGSGGDSVTGFGGDGGQGGDGGVEAGGPGGVVTASTKGGRALPISILASNISGGGGGGSGARDGLNNNGGGGGGGGGLIILVYNSLTTGTERALGGAAGNGFGTGDNGVAGSSGTIITVANA